MQITFNTNSYSNVAMGNSKRTKKQPTISELLKPLETDPKAVIPSLKLMKGINPNSPDVFASFTKIDDATREIGFTLDKDAWTNCLKAELQEFISARQEYEQEQTPFNKEHMIEEMGDILFTAASIAKDSGIDAKEAFQTTNRKFYNRMSLMERLCKADDKDLATSTKAEKRGWWETAKKKLYMADSIRHSRQEASLSLNA